MPSEVYMSSERSRRLRIRIVQRALLITLYADCEFERIAFISSTHSIYTWPDFIRTGANFISHPSGPLRIWRPYDTFQFVQITEAQMAKIGG